MRSSRVRWFLRVVTQVKDEGARVRIATVTDDDVDDVTAHRIDALGPFFRAGG